VVVVVGEGHAHALADVFGNAALGRDVLERAVATVPIEAVRQTLEIAGMAVDAHAPRLIAAVAASLGGPAHVVDHQQVEPAVGVVVEPAGRGGPLATAACRRSHPVF